MMTDSAIFPDSNPFNENSNDPFVGVVNTGGIISTTPPDIEDFINQHGFGKRAYVCSIKKAPSDGSAHKEHLPCMTKGYYTPIEELGKRFGPGQYLYCFSWDSGKEESETNPNKRKKSYVEHKVYLGEEWALIHDEYMAELHFASRKKIDTLKDRMKISRIARGESENTSDPIENMKQTMTVLKDLGVPVGGTGGSNDTVNLMMMMMQNQQQQQQESTKMMMQMFAMMQQSTTQMIQVVMGNRQEQPSSNMNQFKEMMTMVQGMVNMKEIMSPEKRSTVDRIFELAESVMPAIMQIASQPPAARAANPIVGMVKAHPDFKEMSADPMMQQELIKKWDAAHGREQTDVIIDTVGWKRESSDEYEDVDE